MLDRFLRLPKVVELTGLPRSSVYQRVNEGSFPRPLRLGHRTVAWRESDIRGWQKDIVSKNNTTVWGGRDE